MASSIDSTKPTQGTALTADVRTNFGHAKTEIDALQVKTTGIVNVNDFGTVQEAVNNANSNNYIMFWPEVKTVTSNVTNFHNVKHFGPGGLKRGSNTWYVEGSPVDMANPDAATTRRLYVHSTNGSDTNDGLDSANALQYEPEALKAMLTIRHSSNETGFITLATGHVIKDLSMMTVDNVDAGWITIEGEGTLGNSGYDYDSSRITKPIDRPADSTATVGSGAITQSGWVFTSANSNPVTTSCTANSSARYVVAVDAIAPTLDIFVDGNTQLDRLYSLTNSRGTISGDTTDAKGGKNFRDNDVSSSRPLYGNNGSSIRASNCVFDDFTGSIYISRGSTANMTSTLVKGRRSGFDTAGSAIGNGSVTASRTGTIEGNQMEFESCNLPIEVKRCAGFNAHRAIFRSCTNHLGIIHRAASLSVDGCMAFNTLASSGNRNGAFSYDGHGFEITDAGTLSIASGGTTWGFSKVFAASNNTAGEGIRVTGSGTACARQIEMSGFNYNIYVKGNGQVEVSNSVLKNADAHNILIEGSGECEARFAAISGAGTDNVVATNNGNVNLESALLVASGRRDITVFQGGLISAHGCTTTLSATVAITAATKTNPVVVTTTTTNLEDGDLIYIESVGGMTELNNTVFQVAGKTGTTINLQDEYGTNINGTGYTTYTSGGTVRHGKPSGGSDTSPQTYNTLSEKGFILVET